MHWGYDQVKWRGPEEVERVMSKRTLPKGLHFPDVVATPWPRAAFEEDFILIAEFSENEGPRPVLTIPSEGGGTFDKNAFAVHVMSVDYHAQERNTAFSVAEDTQLFLSEKKERVYAYVHHFTLYDIHARGFVRPFCMCYLSHCKRKLLNSMEQLMTEFNKVSRLFRFGNRIVFSRDLHQRLLDLISLRGATDNRTKYKEHYDQVWSETQRIIEALKPHMNDPRIRHQFEELEMLAKKRNRSSTDAAKRSHRYKDDCSMSQDQQGNHKLRKAYSLSRLDVLLKQQVEQDRKSRVFSPAYLHNCRQLRNMHDLCEWGAKEGLNRLRNIHRHFVQEAIALDVERTEALLIDPRHSLLTVGHSVVTNFLHKVDLKKSRQHLCTKMCAIQPQISALARRPSLGSSGSCYSLDSFKSCLEEDIASSVRSCESALSPFIPCLSFHKEMHGDENWESGYERQSSSSLSGSPSSDATGMRSDASTADSVSFSEFCVIDDSVVIRRQNSDFEINRQNQPLNQLSRKSYSLENLPSMQRPRDVDFRQRLDPSLAPNPSRIHTEETHNLVGSGQEKSLSESAVSFRSVNPVIKQGDSMHRKPNATSKLEKTPLRCYVEEVCQPASNASVLSRVLDFKNHFIFGIHLAFALMSGRPVVIMADSSNEREVRLLVSALWMFVPQKTSANGWVVFPWRRKPLHVTDLASLKLAGLCKSRHGNMLPKSVKRYVSVLDFETSCLLTPPYKGIFLSTIFNSRNAWPTNTSLVAFIHSVFLEFASKAYVYYYAHCLNGPNKCTCNYGDRSQVKQPSDEVEVLNRLEIHFSDAKIIQYFCEVLKDQQIDFFHSSEQGHRPPSISADLCQCKQFRNVASLDTVQ
ncbi:guanine nucleotide exchange protein smcr8a [Nematostella vectensis]|uniref:guanine nucleotide exchange protein smcr8a n=1 Tax=Nematostella vectensis TaxID=45351 RepID=UPI00207757D2|nr:guanine nucleotide exchange protein smcr8a [Nematostella vectensis]